MNAVWGQLLVLCLDCCFLLPSGHIIPTNVFLPLWRCCAAEKLLLSMFQPPASNRATVSYCQGYSWWHRGL